MLQLAAGPVWYTGQQGHILQALRMSGRPRHRCVLLCSSPRPLSHPVKQSGTFDSEGNVVSRLALIGSMMMMMLMMMMLMLHHSYSQ